MNPTKYQASAGQMTGMKTTPTKQVVNEKAIQAALKVKPSKLKVDNFSKPIQFNPTTCHKDLHYQITWPRQQVILKRESIMLGN